MSYFTNVGPMSGPNILLPATIDAEFLERFPRTCILGSDTRANERHIDFDNGQHVGSPDILACNRANRP